MPKGTGYTRRSLAGLVAAAASATAQNAPKDTPDANAQDAARALERNALAISKAQVPRSTEPAFRFQA